MNELSILHLSDLHIDGSGGSYSRVLTSLLADIKQEIKHTQENSLIVAVTGDIINQGVLYKENEKAYNHAVQFFQDLYNCLEGMVCGIYIVPGNHDKYRTKVDQFLIPSYREIKEGYNAEKSKYDTSFKQSFWKEHLKAYSKEYGTGYVELTRDIYKIFGMTEDDINSKCFVKDTFGVDIKDICGRRYCFVLLNTAWSCVNDLDNRNLILGKFQLESLVHQFHELADRNRPDLTIILGHHPINSLNGKEEDFLFKEMISFESLDANLYLCGHTHDREVINWINNRHSINTFVTGIGWPDSGRSHVESHTYATYVINHELNSIDVYMRDTNDGGKFKPDFRIYTNDDSIHNNKLTFPIRAHNTQMYIPLSRGNGRSQKSFYLSNEFLDYIKQYLLNVSRIELEIGKYIEIIKSEYYENAEASTLHNGKTDDLTDDDLNDSIESEILYNYLFAQTYEDRDFKDESSDNDLKKILEENSVLGYQLFLAYLQKICQLFQKYLVGDEYDEGDIVRFHFRYLADKNSLTYRSLCTSFPKKINKDEYSVSDIKYGQLIEEAYVSGRSLIYSLNEQSTNRDLKERWKDFITIVPGFHNSNYLKKYGNKSTKKVPLLTFGITINNGKFENMLYCLDYFSIKTTVEDAINEYVELFDINVKEFCSWAKNYLEVGEVSHEV